jgi:uncharacterized protein DUF6883
VKLPNAENALVDLEKLRSYALDPTHRVGRHKARLFATLLGLGKGNAAELRDILLEAARTLDAELGEHGAHGQRYRIDFMVTWRDRQAQIRSAWIVRPEEDFPRLVTCYPVPEGRQ